VRGHILVHHAVGNVGLNQQRLRIRSWERSRNSSSESPARRVRAVHSYREEQSGKRNWDHARCCGTVARGSSRECAETACGLRERRHGGASRAVPGGARPSGHCCKSGPAGYEFLYATAICIDGNTFYPSRERFVSPLSRLLAVATKSPICQTLAVGSFESKADLPPHAVAIKTGAIDLSIK